MRDTVCSFVYLLLVRITLSLLNSASYSSSSTDSESLSFYVNVVFILTGISQGGMFQLYSDEKAFFMETTL